ncbi:amino acid ABC transporter ATP-binding protein [Cetobacterium sp. 8H]|uniref:amino acid ABC transporter ATP-binding protein n=2 Tax=unclassified Cetobacterium TaxID=2630983 RepID=UPI00163CE55D|nr:amino acid ABC transporter ATP-binding protein [Cetobacterium sp. 8H]MBC2851836.1 amino acid ABC transporter ATP-binding protein [Cetobacterium sp. 8H]
MAIKIRNLNKNFGENSIFKNLNLDILQGEIVSIIGPSGKGKSTFLRCLIGLEKIDSGSIICDRNKMGMVFQNFNLFPHKTVLENIIEPLIVVDKIDKEKAKEKAFSLLKKVGLEDKWNTFPKYLSGGQKQRVAIARALAKDPEILLFDEPTSALDPFMTQEVLSVIEDLKASQGITMIIVSHEMDFVNKISTRIIEF